MTRFGEPPPYEAFDGHANYNNGGGNDSNTQPGPGVIPNATNPGAPSNFNNHPTGGVPVGAPAGGQTQPPTGFAPGPPAGGNINPPTVPQPGVTGGSHNHTPQAPGTGGGHPGRGGFGSGSRGGSNARGQGFVGRGGRGGYGGRGGQAGSVPRTFEFNDQPGMQDQTHEFDDNMNDGHYGMQYLDYGDEVDDRMLVDVADINGPPDFYRWRSYDGIHPIFSDMGIPLPTDAEYGMWGFYNGIPQAVGSPLGVIFGFRPPRVQGLRRIFNMRDGIFFYVPASARPMSPYRWY